MTGLSNRGDFAQLFYCCRKTTRIIATYCFKKIILHLTHTESGTDQNADFIFTITNESKGLT
jgi:hypothetical protein